MCNPEVTGAPARLQSRDNRTMAQVLTFPEPIASLAVRRPGREKFSDEDYWAFCEANPDLRVERTAQGEIVIVPPAGGESDYRNLQVSTALNIWASCPTAPASRPTQRGFQTPRSIA